MAESKAPVNTFYPMPHRIRKKVTYDQAGATIHCGSLPDRAIALKDEMAQGLFVVTAFNGGSGDTVDVGYAAHKDRTGATVVADPNAFGTAIDVSTTGWKPLDEAASEFFANANNDGVPITMAYTDTSGDASAGEAVLIIGFDPPEVGE